MSRILFAGVLIALGGVLLYLGNQRKESLAGAAQSFGHEVASALDGKARVTNQTVYFATGGALIFVGLAIALRRS